MHDKLTRTLPDWRLPEAHLLALIRALDKRQDWDREVPLMVEYLRRFPQQAAAVRLRLAEILIAAWQRPTQALRVLEKIQLDKLNEAQQRRWRQLMERANVLKREGPLEVAGEDW